MPNSGYFDVPFAQSGSRTSVPDAAPIDGSVNYSQGWGINYTLNPATNPSALDVSNTAMNQILYDITLAIQNYQQNGIPPFITTAMNNGTPFSYAQYAQVMYGGVAYQSNTAGNTDTPPSSKWNVITLNSPNQFIGGTTTGSANAQVLASTSPSTGLSLSIANQQLAFTPGFTNTGSTTLAVTSDGIPPTLIKKLSGGVLVNLTGGELTNGVTAYVSVNNSVPCFVLSAGPALGTMASLNLGNNMANDTNGNAVATVPPLALTGTSKTFQLAQWGGFLQRSNSGTAMTDTLPGTTGALPSGWYAELQNNDATASDTVSVGSGGAIYMGNQVLSAFTMAPGENWAVFSQGSGVYEIQRTNAATLHGGVPQSTVKNLAAAYVSTTTANITADAVVVQDASGNTRRMTSVNQTFNLAASVGANTGLDAGVLAANTWYYGYVTYNPTTNAQGCIFSASPTSPTLPSGYTFASGPLTAFLTNGSSQVTGYQQRGRNWQYKVGSNCPNVPVLATGSAGNVSTPTWQSVSVTSAIPVAIAATGRFFLTQQTNLAMAAPNSSYGAYSSSTNPPPMVTTGGNGTSWGEFVLEGNSIQWASQSAALLSCEGFTINI